MALYALSDLHLHWSDQRHLFTPEKEEVFVRVVNEILREDGELLIAGDCIDFTGMLPPTIGHREFFEELFSGADLKHPAIERVLEPASSLTNLRKTHQKFPHFFESLGKLARQRKLKMMPGNHDCILHERQIQDEFCRLVGSKQIQWVAELFTSDGIYFGHGNQFDASNQTDRHCYSPGAAITSALFNAMMPALAAFGVSEEIVSAVPAVRPEELVVHGIQKILGERDTIRLVQAFVKLITRNGYFSGWKRVAMLPILSSMPFLSDWMRSYLTPDHLLKAMPDERGMRNHVREEAERLHARFGDRARVVVLGHTHELDHSEHYMNLGTWIDHLTGISLDHLRSADTSLPVLLSSEGRVSLYDARDLSAGGSLEKCREIYASLQVPMQGPQAAA